MYSKINRIFLHEHNDYIWRKLFIKYIRIFYRESTCTKKWMITLQVICCEGYITVETSKWHHWNFIHVTSWKEYFNNTSWSSFLMSVQNLHIYIKYYMINLWQLHLF